MYVYAYSGIISCELFVFFFFLGGGGLDKLLRNITGGVQEIFTHCYRGGGKVLIFLRYVIFEHPLLTCVVLAVKGIDVDHTATNLKIILEQIVRTEGEQSKG